MCVGTGTRYVVSKQPIVGGHFYIMLVGVIHSITQSQIVLGMFLPILFSARHRENKHVTGTTIVKG